MERGLACAPGSVPTLSAAVAAVEKIRFFAGREQDISQHPQLCQRLRRLLGRPACATSCFQVKPLRVQRAGSCTSCTRVLHHTSSGVSMCAGEVRSKARMHVTIGHTTAMADLQFFGLPAAQQTQPPQPDAGSQRPSQTTEQVMSPCGGMYANAHCRAAVTIAEVTVSRGPSR